MSGHMWACDMRKLALTSRLRRSASSREGLGMPRSLTSASSVVRLDCRPRSESCARTMPPAQEHSQTGYACAL